MGRLKQRPQSRLGGQTHSAFWRLAAFGALVLFAGATRLFAAGFTATLSRDTITLGENVQLTLTFEGDAPNDTPGLPALPGVQVFPGGRSSQFTFANGQATSIVTHTYTLTPTQVGDIDIPALRANVGGRVLASQPLKLRVLKPGAPPPNADALAKSLAFLRLVAPRNEIFVGETIVAELQLYVRDGVQDIKDFQLTGTPANGLTVGKTAQGQQRRAQVGNGLFTVVPFLMTLSAVRTGPLTVGPITCTVVAQLPSDRRSRDPFDPFGMFQRPNYQRLALATDEVTIQGLPLPVENKPANFSGAVGNFTLSMTAGPTNVAVGDPITVKVQLSGRGPIETLSLPEQTSWREFKTYPPTTKVDLTDQLGLQGTKTLEQVVAPQNAEIKALPPISFSFFDPESKAYRTLTQPPVALAVRPAGATPTPTLAGANTGKTEDQPPKQDIVPIKQHLGALARIEPPLVQQPWFLAVQAVPVLAWAGLLGWRKRAEALANNPRLRRQRQVAQVIRDGQGQLRRLAAENNSDEFFATLFRLLQEQLGERLDLPASAITEAVVDERLSPRGVDQATLDSVRDLFHLCNLARYAPVRSSQELSAIIPRLDQTLRDLQSLRI